MPNVHKTITFTTFENGLDLKERVTNILCLGNKYSVALLPL